MATVEQTSQSTRDTPVPSEKRVLNAWCAWLGALATNAEAALAAALAYKQLDGPARESWLAAVADSWAPRDVSAMTLVI